MSTRIERRIANTAYNLIVVSKCAAVPRLERMLLSQDVLSKSVDLYVRTCPDGGTAKMAVITHLTHVLDWAVRHADVLERRGCGEAP